MAKVLRAPDVPQWDTSKPFMAEYCPFKIYRVKQTDVEDVLFCATRNFTYGSGLDPFVSLFKREGGVIWRMSGEGSLFNSWKQSTPKNIREIGLLPGRKDFETRNKEEPGDCLEAK